MDGKILGIPDQAAIAAFRNTKTMDRCICLARNDSINFGCGIVGGNGDFFWERFDGLAWSLRSAMISSFSIGN